MTSGRIARCVYDGRTYEIPEIWLAGWQQGARLRGEPSTIADAIATWAWHDRLTREEASTARLSDVTP